LLNLKFKAAFQIVLMITMVFFTAFSISPAYAAEEINVCCEQTKGGEYCQYVDEGSCDSSFGVFPGECENFANCAPTCCDLSSELQGCMINVPAAACDAQGGEALPDASCDYEQCKPGCCEIGSQCAFVTEKECQNYGAELPMLDVEFGFVNSELECLTKCVNKEKGACVTDEGCTYGVGSECVVGEFFDNQYCSEVSVDCPAKSEKKCVDGSDDVWWFDSCGNQEGVVEEDASNLDGNCDYASGTVCGKVDGEVACMNTACVSTEVNPFNPTSLGAAKKNGESWCQYDANSGPTLDLPGSRHFRHYCYNGEEHVEECEDFRGEYCIQGSVKTESGELFGFAACKENRFEDCWECENQECCHDYDLRDCVWKSEEDEKKGEDYKDELNSRTDEDFEIEADYDNDKGFCLPMVPPGNKFWEDDEGLCDNADSGSDTQIGKLKSQWAGLREFDCKAGCDLYTDDMLKGLNGLCRAQGDCGADYNLVAGWSNRGFNRDSSHSSAVLRKHGRSEYGDIDSSIAKSMKLSNSDGDNMAKEMFDYASEHSRVEKDSDDFKESRRIYTGAFDIGVFELDSVQSMGEYFFTDGPASSRALGVTFSIVSIGLTGIATFGVVVAAMVGAEILATGTVMLAVPIWGWIAFAVLAIAVTVGTFFGYQTRSETIETDCNAWQPPGGDSKCHLCHEPGDDAFGKDIDLTLGGLHECTEYLCKSLGGACDFIDTIDGARCLPGNCNHDVPSPIIHPPEEITGGTCVSHQGAGATEIDCEVTLKQDGTSKRDGYSMGGFIKAHTDFTFTVTTWNDFSKTEDQYSTCRWSFEEHGNDYDLYEKNFLQVSNAVVHNLTLKAKDLEPFADGMEHNIYVMCEDPCENHNDRPYSVQFRVQEEPDMTPPEIGPFDPQSGSYLPANLPENKTPIRLILNEDVAELAGEVTDNSPGCKWSFYDESYEVMKNRLECTGGNIGKDATCDGYLTNISLGENRFYFRCMDDDGNVNGEGWPENGYVVYGTNALKIDSVECVSEYGRECGEIPTDEFDLEVSTSIGAEDGKATCEYGKLSPMADFQETDASLHKQHMGPMPTGDYDYNVWCNDTAGNRVNQSFSFSLYSDDEDPMIEKVYYLSGYIHVITSEDATCKYGDEKPLNFEEATSFDATGAKEHTVAVAEKPYFVIKCEDLFENKLDEFELFLTKKQ
jgi:hypothetical protein